MNHDKVRAIYQDQRIAEEFCNFKCEYCEGFCPTEYSLKKDKFGNLNVPIEWYKQMKSFPDEVQSFFKNGRSISEFYNIATGVMNESKKILNTDILKISGGELTINPELCDFVKSVHKDYLMVQILTNGFKLSEADIKRYKEMGNITFQISLDGVSAEANYSKSHSSFITKRVVDNVKLLLNYGIGVEINCVLTKYNTDKFLEFLKYFKDAKGLVIVPRPVRGEPRTVLDFNDEQIIEFENCIKNYYKDFQNILPPLEYFNRLISLMKFKVRKHKCYVPYFVQSIDGYGRYEKCPLGMQYDKYLNILDSSVDKNDILINSNYASNENNSICKYCMIQYEILNLFVDGVINEQELKKMPSLNNDIIIEHISEIKQKVLKK